MIRHLLLFEAGQPLEGRLASSDSDGSTESDVRSFFPVRVHTTELPPVVILYNPVVEAYRKKSLYRERVSDVSLAAQSVRDLRSKAGWSAAEAARRVRQMSAALGQSLDLSQQAVSKFETGKGKTIPKWVEILELAVQYDECSLAERFAFLNRRRSEFAPTPPVEERVQFAGLFVALPSENLLTEMFHTMIDSMPSADRDSLPRELAKLLPTALEQLKWSALELRPAARSSPLEPSADHSSETPESQRVARA